MKFKGLAILVLAFLVVGVFTYDASASACRHAGSALLFPEFNKNPAENISMVTITNTGPHDIWLRFVWVYTAEEQHGLVCRPANQYIPLTKYDTLTFLDNALSNAPSNSEGFLYVYVVDYEGSTAEVEYNYLIGQAGIYEVPNTVNVVIGYSYNAVAFKALAAVDDFQPNATGPYSTGDGLLELDGTEYSRPPKTLYFPKFLGQPDADPVNGPAANAQSWLIVVNLTGGKYYGADGVLEIYNDNEKVFSDVFEVPCWSKTKLGDVAEAFRLSSLFSAWNLPQNNLDEPWGMADYLETGWFYMFGEWAFSNWPNSELKEKPSVYAVLVEMVNDEWGNADLPFQDEGDVAGEYVGSLWPTSF